MIKTLFYGIMTLFVSVGSFVAALTSTGNPWPGVFVAFGAILLFLYNLNRRWRKADEKRIRERLFNEHMRKNYGYKRQ